MKLEYEYFEDDDQCRVDKGNKWVLFNDPKVSPERVAISEGNWSEEELDRAQRLADKVFSRGH